MINDSILVILSLLCLLIPSQVSSPILLWIQYSWCPPCLHTFRRRKIFSQNYTCEANAQSQASFSEQATVRKSIENIACLRILDWLAFYCGRALLKTGRALFIQKFNRSVASLQNFALSPELIFASCHRYFKSFSSAGWCGYPMFGMPGVWWISSQLLQHLRVCSVDIFYPLIMLITFIVTHSY